MKDVKADTASEEQPTVRWMDPTTDTVDLTVAQCQELDESLFESNPAAYWRSRIDMLLREPAPVDYRHSVLGLGHERDELGAKRLYRRLEQAAPSHHGVQAE